MAWGAAAQQESEPVVVEVPEAEAEPLDVLDAERLVPSVVALVSRVRCQRRIGISQGAMVRAKRSSSGTSLAAQ
jgi:hypothetical protein